LHGEGLYQLSSTGGSSTGYHYNLKDHLGNVCVVVNQSNTVVDQTDYYPFGMNMTPKFAGGLNNLYKYNGKELQEDKIGGSELDWYDYGARMYDPAIGRWQCIDPLAQKYDPVSPYNYVFNNPINHIDPDGQEPVTLTLLTVAGISALVGTSAYAINYSYIKNSYSRRGPDKFYSSHTYYNMRALGAYFGDLFAKSKNKRKPGASSSHSNKRQSANRNFLKGKPNLDPKNYPPALGGAAALGIMAKYAIQHKQNVNVGYNEFKMQNYNSFFYNNQSNSKISDLLDILTIKMPYDPTIHEEPVGNSAPNPTIDPNLIPQPNVDPIDPNYTPSVSPMPVPTPEPDRPLPSDLPTEFIIPPHLL